MHPVQRPVRFGTAALTPDRARPGAWTLTIDGVAQSYVHLADPTYLRLPYATWIAHLVDHHFHPAHAIAALHIGGGACTLPRYLAATRPGSPQNVFEPDAPLIALLRDHLALDSIPHTRIHPQDGRTALTTLPDQSFDLVIVDVFRGATPVTELATLELLHEIARILRPGGLYTANLWGAGDLLFVRRASAATTTVFPHFLALAEAAVFMRHRPGNVVAAASTRPLPDPHLPHVSTLTALQLSAILGAASPLTDAKPLAEPVPGVHPLRLGPDSP